MTYNRKPCATLFLEPEYDALILEAYSKSRVTTERLKNGRYLFSCIFCKEIHKDKNMTSYHRMFNLCKVYKEHVALKMYLTWEKKSDHGELHMITKKYGKVFVINMPPKPSAPLKRKAEDLLLPPREKRRQVPSSAVSKPLEEGPCKVSGSRDSSKPVRVKFQETQVQQVSDDSDEETCDERGQEHSEKGDIEDETTPNAAQDSLDVCSDSLAASSDERDNRVVRHCPKGRALTRKDVEERAQDKARLKFPA